MSSAFCSCSIYSFFPLILFISFSLHPLYLFFLSSALFLSPHPLYLFFPSSSLSLFPLTLFISFSPHPLCLPPPSPPSSSLSLFPLILFISFSPHPLYLFFPLIFFISFSSHPLYLFFPSSSVSSPPPSSSLSLFSLILFISFSPHPHYPLILFISFSPFPSSTLSFVFLSSSFLSLFPPDPFYFFPLVLFISSPHPLYLFFPLFSLSLFPLILFISFFSSSSISFTVFVHPLLSLFILVLFISFSSHLLAFLSHFFLFCEMLHCTNPFIIILSIISIWLKPWHAEQIKMPSPLLIFIQSDKLIQVVYTNSHISVMTNSADSDQLASSEASWSGSALFAMAGHIKVKQD